ncbi:MAG: hypothetical protein GEV08_12310 [Acidimicrobiia bacterium]|nr:hypothetical protein [Acidimicrobiia bacterium]
MEWLADIDDEVGELPRAVLEVRGMISYEERALLHHLAAEVGDGAIVELGCFVGASTLALATGLAAQGAKGPVHAYDLLRFDEYGMGGYLDGLVEPVQGTDLVPLFKKHLGAYIDLVELHVGDVNRAPWDGPGIELLFIDIAKSWRTNRYITKTFFPWLVPGAVVVQQDLVHWEFPWVAMTMAALSDHFEPLGFVPFGSMVYRCTRPPTKDDADLDLRGMPLQQQLDLVSAEQDRIDERARPWLELAKANLYVHAGDQDLALSTIEKVEAAVGESVQWIEVGFQRLRERASALGQP